MALLNPPAAGQFQDLGLGKARHGTKVECIEVLRHREAGLFNVRLQGIGTARGQFQLRQSQQVFQVVLIAVGRLAGELRVLGQHRRQPQGFEGSVQEQGRFFLSHDLILREKVTSRICAGPAAEPGPRESIAAAYWCHSIHEAWRGAPVARSTR